jgi:hypothetical protein
MALLYVAHALAHIFPPATIQKFMAEQNIPRLRTTTNLLELLASAGLVLPGLLGTATWLTPLSAAVLLLVMLGAIGFHVLRREYSYAMGPFVLALCDALIAYGRWQIVPLR